MMPPALSGAGERPVTRGPRRRLYRSWDVLVVGALLFCGVQTTVADQSDARLPALFEQLLVAPDVYTAAAVEGQIWQIWLDANDSKLNRMVESGIDAMNAGQMQAAIAIFDDVIARAPNYAEGWNKRATVYYLIDEMEKSVSDIHRTLALEPKHFGAISGLGLIFLRQGDERGAACIP